MSKKIISYIILPLMYFPIIVFGQTLENPLGSNKSLSALFEAITNVAIQLGTVVAGLAIMYAGFMYVTANGNEEKISGAQKTLTWAVIGAAILLGAKVIFTAIKGTVTSLG